MNHGHPFAASRLARLSAEDRQWLYGQLSPDERASLYDYLSLDVGTETRKNVERAVRDTPSAEEIVARATAWQITQALIDEPEWMLALLLSRRSWSWTADCLDAMEEARRDRLKALVSPVKKSTRESAYMAAIMALAEKIERISPEFMEKTMEVGVARLMKLRPVDD